MALWRRWRVVEDPIPLGDLGDGLSAGGESPVVDESLGLPQKLSIGALS